MKLTPLDIDQQQFPRVLRGCDPDQVHAFLDQISRDMEELIRENTQLKELTRQQQRQLDEFRKHDEQLREALVSAGRMTDEIKSSARKEAELMRAEAELEAERVIGGAREQVVRLAEEVRGLRLQKSRLMSELRSIVDAHRRLIETHEQLELDDRAREEQNARAHRRNGERGGRV
ncbi:MAG: DivIVA domain-containing protein [Myxococcales bacterium]|nr:DivIVA domain-containing protein [Myxococcales bacterium]